MSCYVYSFDNRNINTFVKIFLIGDLTGGGMFDEPDDYAPEVQKISSKKKKSKHEDSDSSVDEDLKAFKKLKANKQQNPKISTITNRQRVKSSKSKNSKHKKNSRK